jgi:hypothetical protein
LYRYIAITTTLFTMLEFLRHEEWSIRISAALISGFGLSILFILGYLKLWGGKNDEEGDGEN